MFSHPGVIPSVPADHCFTGRFFQVVDQLGAWPERVPAVIILACLLTGCTADRSPSHDLGVMPEPPAWYQARMASEQSALAAPSSEPTGQQQLNTGDQPLSYVLYNMDRRAVLADCRRLTRTYKRYKSVFKTFVHGNPAPVYLIDPEDPMLPRSIRALRPSRVAVTDARVNLELGTPQHPFHLLAFAQGAKFEGDVQGMFQNGDGRGRGTEEVLTHRGFRQLIDGLWYYSEVASDDR